MDQPPRDPVDPLDDTVVRDDWVDDTVVVEEDEAPVRRPPLIWPYLLAFLVLVLGGLGAYWYFSQEDESTVPAIVGQREARAQATVREAGFEPRSERRESAKPQGVVLDQDPDGGTTLEEGKTVLLTVSSGPARGTVPNVVGRQRDEAVGAVETAGFEAVVTGAFSDKQAGIVTRQAPAAGRSRKEGSTVRLTVSKGREPVEVPDVVGTTSSEATATLRAAGLDANLVSVASDRPAGTVLAQNPAAGTTVKAGSRVRLNVAQAPGATTGATTAPPPATTTEPTPAPAPATVPDVVGQELAVGARGFDDEGLKVSVRYVPADEPQGRIIAQARPAGTEVQRGDTVQVNVSTGPAPASARGVPDVTGLQEREARSRLEAAGYEVLAIGLDPEGSKVGTVASQTPAGRAIVPRGSLVILYVRT